MEAVVLFCCSILGDRRRRGRARRGSTSRNRRCDTRCPGFLSLSPRALTTTLPWSVLGNSGTRTFSPRWCAYSSSASGGGRHGADGCASPDTATRLSAICPSSECRWGGGGGRLIALCSTCDTAGFSLVLALLLKPSLLQGGSALGLALFPCGSGLFFYFALGTFGCFGGSFLLCTDTFLFGGTFCKESTLV